jgi:glycerophosphoryl diester phosphodiesterase
VTRRRAEAGIAVSVLAAILVATTGGADPQTRIAAHRGGAPRWRPRNSMTAFRGAIALGADALEFDVHLTADGEPVVIRDAAPRAHHHGPRRRRRRHAVPAPGAAHEGA